MGLILRGYLKRCPGKAKQELKAGILKSRPYLIVQALGVSRVIMLQNAEAAASQKNELFFSSHFFFFFSPLEALIFTYKISLHSQSKKRRRNLL